MSTACLATPAPRTSFQLLVDRDFGVLFWGKLSSLISVWAFFVLTVTLTYRLTGSGTWVGVVGAANLAPQLALSLMAGRLSDSRGPRVPILAGTTMAGLSALALAAWTSRADLTHAGGVWVVLGGSLAFGVGLALSVPATHSATPQLVRPDELSTAVALNFFPTALGRAVGPALGAGIAAFAGPAGALLMAGLASLLAAAAFTRLHIERSPASDDDRSVRAALSYVRARRPLAALLAAVATVAIGAEPSLSLAPVLTERVGASGSGTVVVAFGVGGILGLLVHRALTVRTGPREEGLLALWALALAVLVSAVAWSPWVLTGGSALAGTASVVGMTALSVGVQQRTSRPMMGRVMALWVLAFAGARPVASLVQGTATDHAGLLPTMVATAALVAVVAVWVRRATPRTAESETTATSGTMAA